MSSLVLDLYFLPQALFFRQIHLILLIFFCVCVLSHVFGLLGAQLWSKVGGNIWPPRLKSGEVLSFFFFSLKFEDFAYLPTRSTLQHPETRRDISQEISSASHVRCYFSAVYSVCVWCYLHMCMCF